MSSKYQKNKTHIYNYREKNLDKVREMQKLYKRRKDTWLKIQKEFFNILFD